MTARMRSFVCTSFGLSLLGSLSLLTMSQGCAGVADRKLEPVDCSATDGYDLSIKDDFETGMSPGNWFSAGDGTGQLAYVAPPISTWCGGTTPVPGPTAPGVVTTVEFAGIDGGRCGSSQALHLLSFGHNDWGSFFGNWSIAQTTSDQSLNGSGYAGLTFWARRNGGDAGITLAIDTWQTAPPATGATIEADDEVCKPDCNAGSGSGTQSVDASGNILSQSYVSPPGSCGNSFQRTVVLSENWQLYLLPFSSFFQDLKPNMSPNGLNPKHINGLLFRVPKESRVDIWIDDVGFYKRKP